MKHNIDLNKLMNEKGFWSFDFFSLCPFETNKPTQYGNFEFVTQKNYNTIELYVRYIGTDLKFTWLNVSSQTNNYYKDSGSSAVINGKVYCKISRSWGGVNKNKTFTPASIVHNIEDAKTFREGLNYKNKPSYGKEKEIKLFKKEVKKYKELWEKNRKEIVEAAYQISYEEWQKDQIQLADSESTKFILKVAPMLTRLKDECTLILDQLNEPNGPSVQAKEDFINSYKKFQGFYGNRTYLTSLRYFKAKKGKNKKK